MADRKENELTKANNFEYVRALDSNGNSIQISKSDLVSVLEELLPGLKILKVKGGIDNLERNDIGIYEVHAETEISPGTSGYGVLVIVGSGWFIRQIFFCDDNRIYVRNVYNGEYKQWYRFEGVSI